MLTPVLCYGMYSIVWYKERITLCACVCACVCVSHGLSHQLKHAVKSMLWIGVCGGSGVCLLLLAGNQWFMRPMACTGCREEEGGVRYRGSGRMNQSSPPSPSLPLPSLFDRLTLKGHATIIRYVLLVFLAQPPFFPLALYLLCNSTAKYPVSWHVLKPLGLYIYM